MLKFLYILGILLYAANCYCQESVPQYKLQQGERYFIKQVLVQNTKTDNMELRGDVSLDITLTLLLKVEKINLDGDYQLTCRYDDLDLNFFSPHEGITLSSQSKEFSSIKDYLQKLEKQTFSIQMTKFGDVFNIHSIDSLIDSFYQEQNYKALKHKLIIKTISEAFGKDALKSLSNMVLNVYDDKPGNNILKKTTVYFNAKPIDIENNLYYSETKSGNLRIQGIGIIEESETLMDVDEFSLNTSLEGNQTYDYLMNAKTGWISEGYSKQKIHTMSTISGRKDIPDGVKIPSITNSEYTFKGGRIDDSNK